MDLRRLAGAVLDVERGHDRGAYFLWSDLSSATTIYTGPAGVSLEGDFLI